MQTEVELHAGSHLCEVSRELFQKVLMKTLFIILCIGQEHAGGGTSVLNKGERGVQPELFIGAN